MVETSFENSETAGPRRASDPFHGWQLLGENIFRNNLGVRSRTDQGLAPGTMVGELRLLMGTGCFLLQQRPEREGELKLEAVSPQDVMEGGSVL